MSNLPFSLFLFLFSFGHKQSDNTLDSDKPRFIDTSNTNNNNHHHLHHQNYRRDSESSPGFDDNTSNSTLSAASPDPADSSLYTLTSTTMTTLNGSQRIPTTTLTSNFSRVSVESWAAKQAAATAAAAATTNTPSTNHQQHPLKPKPRLTPKIEGHLASYERDDERNANLMMANSNNKSDKIDLPKIDISSRRELFEKEQLQQQQQQNAGQQKKISLTGDAEAPAPASIKERLSHLEKRHDEHEIKSTAPPKPNRYSGDFSGVRERFSTEQQHQQQNGQFVTIEPKAPKIDVPVVPLKERLMSLETAMVQAEMPPPTVAPSKKTINEPSKSTIINNNNNTDESVTSSPLHPDDAQSHLKDDEDSGINSDDLQSSLASQQSQSPLAQIGTSDEIKQTPSVEPVPAARKPEVAPRRQITPDLVKITASTAALTIEDDLHLLQSTDDIDDEADDSVSASIANSSPEQSPSSTCIVAKTTKNFVNLTIKNVLVDSHDILKASTSSCSSALSSSPHSASHSMSVVENNQCSGPTTVKLVHNKQHDHIVDTSNNSIDTTTTTTTTNSTCKTDVAKNNHQQSLTTTVDVVVEPPILTESPKKSNTIPIYQNISARTQSNTQSMVVPLKLNNSKINVESSSNQGDDVDGEAKRKQQQQESIQLKNERIKCQIVGVLEKNKIESVAIKNSQGNQSLSAPNTPKSPKSSPILPHKSSPSKTKTIFDFIKRNLLNESTSQSSSKSPSPSPSLRSTTVNSFELPNGHNQHQQHQASESIDHVSNFYVPLLHHDEENNQPSTSKMDIDRLLDTELDKLSDNNDQTTPN